MMSFHQAIPSLVNVNRNVVSYVRMTKDGTSAYKLCSVRLYFQLFVGGHIFIYILCVSFAHSDAQHILCCVFVLFFFVLSSISGSSIFDFPFGIL